MARTLKWTISLVIVFGLLVTGLSYLVKSEMLRGYVEREANRHLKGYTVRIGSAYLHPFSLALDLRDLTLIQNTNPNPPIATMDSFYASIHWRELLSGHLVGELRIDRPKLHVNLKNVREEEKSRVPLKQKGWQEAVLSIYPLRVNVFTIDDGDLTYIDEGPFPPLRMSRIRFKADNIRNIRTPDNVYPSPIELEGTIFETGRLALHGIANFLAEPHATAKTDLKLTDVPLGPFKPITNRQNVSVEKGVLSAEGSLEYGIKTTALALSRVVVSGAEVTYFHLAKTAGAEQKRIEEAGRTAKELSNEPSTRIHADLVKIERSSFGYLDRSTDPNYRIFLGDADLTVRNFTNQLTEKPATFELKGKFMGTGRTVVSGSFLPKTKTPDLRMNIKIEDTQMRAMSDLFQVYGKFDIRSGLFSLYSELAIKGDRIDGYVKPLFRDMSVTDLRSSEEKGVFHKLYLAAVKAATKILKNRPRQEVATQVDISGTIMDPETSTLQILGNLIRNAFFSAILPGFEREAKPPER